MTKYKEYCLQMFDNHKDIFDEFRPLHDKYHKEPSRHQDEFNAKGAKVMEIIKEWEDKLCSRSEGNGYASFTAGLAEKFMEEVRKEFPMIDRIGLVVTKMKPIEKPAPAFALNKINLSSDFDLKKINF